MLLNRLNSRLLLNKLSKKLSRTPIRTSFYQPFKSGDKKYDEAREQEWEQLTEWDKINGGIRIIKDEIKLWIEEMKEKYSLDNSLPRFEDKEIVRLWDFNQNNNDIISSYYNNRRELNDMNRWRTACDSDWNEGQHSFIISIYPTINLPQLHQY